MFGQPPSDDRQHFEEGVLNEQDLPLQWDHVKLHLPLVSVGLYVKRVLRPQLDVGELQVGHHLLHCLMWRQEGERG